MTPVCVRGARSPSTPQVSDPRIPEPAKPSRVRTQAARTNALSPKERQSRIP